MSSINSFKSKYLANKFSHLGEWWNFIREQWGYGSGIWDMGFGMENSNWGGKNRQTVQCSGTASGWRTASTGSATHSRQLPHGSRKNSCISKKIS